MGVHSADARSRRAVGRRGGWARRVDGVPLARVLERAGVKPGAIEVLCEGADRGSEPDHPAPMQFGRSLPLRKALHPDTLLAYRMNGELLAPSHGFPLRLFVPGWYGVRVGEMAAPHRGARAALPGLLQTTKYTIRRWTPHGTESVIVGPMAIKSEILRPRPGEEVSPGAKSRFSVSPGPARRRLPRSRSAPTEAEAGAWPG